MKKVFIRVLCLSLAIIMMLSGLVGCSSMGKTLLEYEGAKISENTYMLFLSRIKGNLASASSFGTEALTSTFWETVVSSDGTTRAESYKKQVLEDSKFYVAVLRKFDELGLKLPESYIESIDKELDELLETDADGSKTAFNAILSKYGANYDVLREAYLIEAKLSYLTEYLYGANGEKISEEVINEYYEANYMRFKHIFLYTYAAVYNEDENGDEIYYLTDGSGRIAYDTSAQKKRNADGEVVTDKKGDVVYVYENGRIAYDKENGGKQPVYDEKGYILTRPYTKDELIAVSDRATLIMNELEGEAGNYTLFDSFCETYSEDAGSAEYKNGFYMTAESNYDSPEVIEALTEMKAGEIRRVHSDYGIHIVMKYELEEGGYKKNENSDFFISTSTGTYSFIYTLMSALLASTLKPYVELVEVDKERYELIDINNVGANFYY